MEQVEMGIPPFTKSLGSQLVRLYEDSVMIMPRWLEIGHAINRLSEARLRLLDILARAGHLPLLVAACVVLIAGASPIIGSLRDWIHNGSLGKLSFTTWGLVMIGLLSIPLSLRALWEAITTPAMMVFDKTKGEVRFLNTVLEFISPRGLPWTSLVLARVPFDNIVSMRFRSPRDTLSGCWELCLCWRQQPRQPRWVDLWWEPDAQPDIHEASIAKMAAAVDEDANLATARELANLLNSIIGRQVLEIEPLAA